VGEILDFYLTRLLVYVEFSHIYVTSKPVWLSGYFLLLVYSVFQYGYLIDPPGVDLEDVETAENELQVLEVWRQ